MSKPDVKTIWKALAKYDIHTPEQFEKAYKELKPLNVSCMVSKPKERDLINEKG